MKGKRIGAGVGLALIAAGAVAGSLPAATASHHQAGKLIFVRFVGNHDIVAMNADGTGFRQLTTNAAQDSQPAWSPDTNGVAFVSDRAGNADIFVMDADGGGQTPLTTDSSGDSQPAWSPNGKRIAFTTDRTGTADIFLMEADGTGVQQITSGSAQDSGSAWSPNGMRIAFQRDGNIWVMDANGGDQVQLSTSGLDGAPDWSPNGQRIAFTHRESDGHLDVYVMSADGSDKTNVTNSPGQHDNDPSWSPNGQWIAFTRGCCTAEHLYAVRRDGSGTTQLTGSLAPPNLEVDWGQGDLD